MDEKYKTETLVIRYYKKPHKKGVYCKGTKTVTSFVKVVP